MWAIPQRDGCPVEYRWRPLFNAAKFGWRPLLECRAVTLPRCETRWNVQGCPKLTKRSQPLVGRSSPYCDDMWRRHCCLISFFYDCRYVPQLQRYSPTKLCDGVQMAIFCILYFQWAACSTFQTCILNSHYGHTMCGSMVDIQSPTAEIWRGKKEERRKKEKEEGNHRAKI